MAPIFLPRARATQSSDDAGILITKTVLPTYKPGPYTPNLLPNHFKPPETPRHVPPLAHFCIKSLLQNVDLIDLGGMSRIPYHSESRMDLLRGLIPFFNSEIRESALRHVDPRMWGTLIQIYSLLPPFFATYTLPLSDTHVTQLQSIRSTPDFTLITVLDLASRPELSDDTIGKLKPLTNLCALDLSRTGIGSWGVRKLAMCLTGRGAERRGPWAMRVLSLRGCEKVDDSVKDGLAKFPLLCAIDLRDTSVTPSSPLSGFTSGPPVSHDLSYHPAPPLSWIPGLSALFPQSRIFESKSPPHVLHIDKLQHPRHNRPDESYRTLSALLLGRIPQRSEKGSGVEEQDRVLALFPNGRQALHTSHALAEQELRREAQGEDRWPFPSSRGYLEYMDNYHNDSDEDESDHDMGPCDFGCCGRPFNDGSDNSEDESQAWDQLYGEIAQQTEVAARVAARETAEQEARSFYGTSAVPGTEGALRLRGSALGASVPWAGTTGRSRISQQPGEREPSPDDEPETSTAGRQARKLARAPNEGDSERSLMFYRTPPSFDCIPGADDDSAGPVRRKNPDEVISVKRRKTASGAGGPPKALLDRLCAIGQDDQGKRAETATTEGGPLKRSLSFGRALQDAGRGPGNGNGKDGSRASTPVSMNPFLAKKKVPSQGQILSLAAALGHPSTVSQPRNTAGSKGTTLGLPPGQGSATQSKAPRSSGSATLPAMFAAATNKPRSTSRQSKLEAVPQFQATAELHLQAGKTSQGRREKGSRGFDMKAWSAKAKK